MTTGQRERERERERERDARTHTDMDALMLCCRSFDRAVFVVGDPFEMIINLFAKVRALCL